MPLIPQMLGDRKQTFSGVPISDGTVLHSETDLFEIVDELALGKREGGSLVLFGCCDGDWVDGGRRWF